MENILKTLEEATERKWYPAESSNIECYQWENDELWVAFKRNKANKVYVYRYYGITDKDFESLNQAPSKGKWVNENLVKPGIRYDKYELR